MSDPELNKKGSDAVTDETSPSSVENDTAGQVVSPSENPNTLPSITEVATVEADGSATPSTQETDPEQTTTEVIMDLEPPAPAPENLEPPAPEPENLEPPAPEPEILEPSAPAPESLEPPASATESVAPTSEQVELETIEPDKVELAIPPTSESNPKASSDTMIPQPETTNIKPFASVPAIPASQVYVDTPAISPSTINMEVPESDELVPESSTKVEASSSAQLNPDSSRMDMGTSTSEYSFPPTFKEIGTNTTDSDPHLPMDSNKRDEWTSTSAEKVNIGTDTSEDTEEPKTNDDDPASEELVAEPSTANDEDPASEELIVEPSTANDEDPASEELIVEPSTANDEDPASEELIVEPSTANDEDPASEELIVEPSTANIEAEEIKEVEELLENEEPDQQTTSPDADAEESKSPSGADLDTNLDDQANVQNSQGDIPPSVPVTGSKLFDDQQWNLEQYPAYWPPELNYPGQHQDIYGYEGPQVTTSAIGSTMSTSGWPGESNIPNPADDEYFYCDDSEYFYCDDNNFLSCDENETQQMNYEDNNCPPEMNQNQSVTQQDMEIQKTFQLGPGDDNGWGQEKCTQTWRKPTFTESALAFLDTLSSIDSIPCNTCDKPLSEIVDPCGDEESVWVWMCSILKDIYNDLATTTKRRKCKEDAPAVNLGNEENANQMEQAASTTVQSVPSEKISGTGDLNTNLTDEQKPESVLSLDPANPDFNDEQTPEPTIPDINDEQKPESALSLNPTNPDNNDEQKPGSALSLDPTNSDVNDEQKPEPTIPDNNDEQKPESALSLNPTDPDVNDEQNPEPTVPDINDEQKPESVLSLIKRTDPDINDEQKPESVLSIIKPTDPDINDEQKPESVVSLVKSTNPDDEPTTSIPAVEEVGDPENPASG